jgi:hypothetical protein
MDPETDTVQNFVRPRIEKLGEIYLTLFDKIQSTWFEKNTAVHTVMHVFYEPLFP